MLARPERQKEQREWSQQWSMIVANEKFLFEDWIKPYSFKDFKNKSILECGCGSGQHTNFMAKYAQDITAIDLNTDHIARQRNKGNNNVTFLKDDIATVTLEKKFDVVISIGVVHHTDDPERTVINMRKHLKKDGLLILWVYSREGNGLIKHVVEPIRKKILCHIARKKLLFLSKLITAIMVIPAYTIYILPLTFLPYYEYIQNFRKLSFIRNAANVFDKLNAPHTDLISEERANRMVAGMEHINISSYKGVSWRISGVNNEI